MRHIPSTEPRFAAPADAPVCIEPATVLAQSALHLTRAAIARWSGSARPAGAPARDLTRVSPQARWVADARCGLAAWIAHGGFAQADEAPLAAPVMHDCAAPLRGIDACID